LPKRSAKNPIRKVKSATITQREAARPPFSANPISRSAPMCASDTESSVEAAAKTSSDTQVVTVSHQTLILLVVATSESSPKHKDYPLRCSFKGELKL